MSDEKSTDDLKSIAQHKRVFRFVSLQFVDGLDMDGELRIGLTVRRIRLPESLKKMIREIIEGEGL